VLRKLVEKNYVGPIGSQSSMKNSCNICTTCTFQWKCKSFINKSKEIRHTLFYKGGHNDNFTPSLFYAKKYWAKNSIVKSQTNTRSSETCQSTLKT
jgi:hypothetical protein